MSSKSYKRKKKWIDPRIQNRFSLCFLTVAGVAVLVQSIVLNGLLLDLARDIPSAGQEIMGRAPLLTLKSLAITLALLAPLCVMIGIRATFPIVGPLHRFRSFLAAVARGEHPEECRIRKTDELQDFCVLLNRVTEPLRKEAGKASSDDKQRAA